MPGPTRRHFIRAGGAAAAGAFVSAGCRSVKTGAEPAGRRPNVIVILTDDQGYGDLACHGNPVLRTPNMDRLHGESVCLTDFHVVPMCSPTRGEIMTGQDCLRNRAMATCMGRHMPLAHLPLLPGILGAAGYRTGLFGKWHLGNEWPYRPFDRGFQEAVYFQGYGLTGADAHWGGDYFDPFYRHRERVKQASGFCTDVWFDRAMDWMDAGRRAGEPFFCYLPTNAPHFPFWVAEPYRRPYAGLPPEGFYGLIANLDENLGRLEDFLRRTGLRDDTILVFLTDNGSAGNGSTAVFNAGMRGGKCARYDGGHRVPCFVRWPAGGLRPPGDLAFPAQAQDLLPTIAEWCGAPLPEGASFDGASLAAPLRGAPGPADRMFVVQYHQNSVERDDAAVVWNRWRLVFGKELYDLQSDPGQERDVSAAHPDVVRRLRAFYETWWAGVEPTLHDLAPVFVGHDRQPYVTLTASDWVGVRCDGADNIRAPSPKVTPRGGPWNLQVERDGEYEIELRRWPREADAALTAGVPELKGREGTLKEGQALPIASARLAVDGEEMSRPAEAGAKGVTFRVRLRCGRARVHGRFLSAAGGDVCGAYFAYVRG